MASARKRLNTSSDYTTPVRAYNPTHGRPGYNQVMIQHDSPAAIVQDNDDDPSNPIMAALNKSLEHGKEILERIGHLERKPVGKPGKLDPIINRRCLMIHNSEEFQSKFDCEKDYRDPSNLSSKLALCAEVKAHFEEQGEHGIKCKFDESEIDRAVYNVYHNMRFKHRMSSPENQEKKEKFAVDKKLRCRRKRKMERRRAAMPEDPLWDGIISDLISDEEDIPDGPDKGKWRVKSPSFRSQQLTELFKECDSLIDNTDPVYSFKRVKSGAFSARPRPYKVLNVNHYTE